ncbi:MAG: catechol 2,3-dioxygenase [Anaerolineae bacterium]
MENTTARIHPAARVGMVSLTVGSLERSLAFYTEVLGLRIQAWEGERARLGADGAFDLLELVEVRGARPARGYTGLYHFALLVPSRRALARTLRRLAEAGWPLQGASDHLVSEALYLADPDGSGIELYRDRPRDEWPRRGGVLQMATLPLNLEALLAEADSPAEMAPATTMGHIHLHVASIAQAEAFYAGVLGFELMQRYGASASFLSAGGYHHHIGVNTWGTQGAPPPPPGAAGLRRFTIALPDEAARAQVIGQVEAAGIPVEQGEGGPLLRDPAGNALELMVR